jgi:DNA-binding HxlR family transcriptional regulator
MRGSTIPLVACVIALIHLRKRREAQHEWDVVVLAVVLECLPAVGATDGPRVCSIADALEILGDRWSLLVVRECGYGVHRFNDIQRNTGAATDILTTRLKRLEAAGILRRERYSERPARYEYSLTESGRQLFPILLALREWGERQLHPDTAPANPVWHDCGAELHVETVCEACRKVVAPQDLRCRRQDDEL